jgi:integrase
LRVDLGNKREGACCHTGLRRGELARLNLDALDRAEATLRIDGRKTERERLCTAAGDGAAVSPQRRMLR